MPHGCGSTSERELNTGHDWDAPAGLVIYLRNVKLPRDRGGNLLETCNLNMAEKGKTLGTKEKSSLACLFQPWLTGPLNNLSPRSPKQPLLMFLLHNFMSLEYAPELTHIKHLFTVSQALLNTLAGRYYH